MSITTYIDPETGAKVIRVPPSMTKKKYRQYLGIKEPWMGVKKSFRICAKFLGIKKEKRLGFLIKMAKKHTHPFLALTKEEIKNRRDGFDSHKFKSYPIAETQLCYCCVKNIAILRHHVIGLANGGRNKRNNMVPLCNSCHSKVHPHLRQFKPVKKKKPSGALASRNSVNSQINGPVAVNPVRQ